MIKTTIKTIKVGDRALSPFGKDYQVVQRLEPESGPLAVVQAVGGAHLARLDDRKLGNGSWLVFGEASA